MTNAPGRPSPPNGDRVGIERTASELERLYDTGAELRLSELRALLEAFDDLARAAAPQPPTIASLLRAADGLGLAWLPLDTIDAVQQVVRDANGADVMASVSLKELERLMSRVQV